MYKAFIGNLTWGSEYMVRLMKFILLAIFLYAGWYFPLAQAESVDNHFQNWDVITLRTPIDNHKKLQLYVEAQPRIGHDFLVLILRSAIGYRLTKRFTIWQGYGWQPTIQPDFRNENRIFQQGLYEIKFKNLSLNSRTRLEERWLEDSHGTAFRARHQIRLAYPLTKSKKWLVVSSDELFINLNSVDNGPQGGFDQNRAYVGISRMLHKHANLELGYLAQFINLHHGQSRLNHALMLSLNLNML
jgi:hypothetical protein